MNRISESDKQYIKALIDDMNVNKQIPKTLYYSFKSLMSELEEQYIEEKYNV